MMMVGEQCVKRKLSDIVMIHSFPPKLGIIKHWKTLMVQESYNFNFFQTQVHSAENKKLIIMRKKLHEFASLGKVFIFIF